MSWAVTVGEGVAARYPMGPHMHRAYLTPAITLAGGVLSVALILSPATLSAVTADQVVALSKAGVSETVILALLDRDRNVLTIDPDQLDTLKREGLSDTLITAMLKNGRAEGDEAARAVAAEQAAAVLSSLSSSPQVAIVGHGPVRPDTVHTEDLYADLRDGVRIPPALPYGSPYAVPFAAPFGPGAYVGTHKRTSSLHRSAKSNRILCLAQVSTARGPGPSYVTECPEVMQRVPGSR